MQCENHPGKKISYKCITCAKFNCSECWKLHDYQNHHLISILQLADIIKNKISIQVNKMEAKIRQLETLRDYETAQTVVEGCMNQILQYVKKLFDQIKLQYRKVADSCWKQENTQSIKQIESKKSILEQWRLTIERKPQQATIFDAQNIYQQNKTESDQQLIDSSQSYILSNMSPKIVFNEIALRRANETLTKIIHTQAKFKPSRKKNTRNLSRGSEKQFRFSSNYSSFCKFVEGTNILYEYVLQDPQANQHEPVMTKIEFREFVVPLRSIGITIANDIYLVGGWNRQNKARKQIMYYERAYTTMRIVGLLKQGRVGHAVCVLNQNIYVFGGKGVRSLEVFNTHSKTCEILVQTKWEIVGASMAAIGDKIFIIGGLVGVQTNKSILCYDITKRILHQQIPFNMEIYFMPIAPILQPISESQILILGGYFLFAGLSYNNSYNILFDTRNSYLTLFGKGELIYPLIANGNNCIFKNKKIVCLSQIKRQRHTHGPNLPVIFTYNLVDESMEIDCMGL